MTYQDLLRHLTELSLLAEPALPGERGGCMSSFDRASQYDPQTDTYLEWSANNDGSGAIERLEDGSIVAFACEGPGVIWRIWSALPQQGAMRVYLDDQEEPAIDVPFIDWFEKQPGDTPPLNYGELSLRLSRGRNSFFPIPFKRRCRVVLSPGWGEYYHFTYTRFPEGTEMPDWSECVSREGLIALAETAHRLYDRGEAEYENVTRTLTRLMPGEEKTVFTRSDSGAICEMTLYPEGVTGDAFLLRRLILKMYWDGRKLPAVEAPLGDFFGGAPGYAHYRCLPMAMERTAFTCRFYMPFAEGCRVTVTNLDVATHDFRMAFATRPLEPKAAAGMLRFHAKWHRGDWQGLNAARFAPGGDRWPDWPLLVVRGAAGRFCGVHMHIFNQWPTPKKPAESWWYGKWDKKSVDWWWGEGDEKFFVDGERFPSTFGTGSEDYIGYAWAAEPPFARFDSAYACMNAMPLDGNGHTSVSRFQIADNVPFQREFCGFIEKYKQDQWGEGAYCLYAVTPYWYQQAGTDDGYPTIDQASLMLGCDS